MRRSGRCGERTERCRWQRKRSERVAAVKIGGVRRKAAQKFWAPQQGHRPLRMRILWCVGRAGYNPAPTECYKECGRTGRRGRRPLRTGTRCAVGRATARVAPTEMLVGADDPVRPMWVCNILVGQGPCALPWVQGKNPPVTASPCQPPLGKGALGTRGTDCHDQRARWSRNDTVNKRCGISPVRADVGIGPYGGFFDRIS